MLLRDISGGDGASRSLGVGAAHLSLALASCGEGTGLLVGVDACTLRLHLPHRCQIGSLLCLTWLVGVDGDGLGVVGVEAAVVGVMVSEVVVVVV